MFQVAAPRLAVYSHIVAPAGTPTDVVEASLLAPTRETYDGPLVVGHDLMRIRVGDTIEVDRAGA